MAETIAVYLMLGRREFIGTGLAGLGGRNLLSKPKQRSAWTVGLPGDPVEFEYHGNTGVTCTKGGKVVSFDLENGQRIATSDISDTLNNIAISKSAVAVISKESLYILNKEDLSVRWEKSIPGELKSLEISEKSALVVADFSKLYSLDLDDGIRNWEVLLEGNEIPDPIVTTDSIIARSGEGTNESALYRIEKGTGNIIWRKDMGSDTKGILAYDEEKRQVATQIEKGFTDAVGVFDLDSGKELYRQVGAAGSRLYLSNGYLAVAGANDMFRGTNSVSVFKNGEKIWSAERTGKPIIDEDTVYLATEREDYETFLLALNKKSGIVRWETDPEDKWRVTDSQDTSRVFVRATNSIEAYWKTGSKPTPTPTATTTSTDSSQDAVNGTPTTSSRNTASAETSSPQSSKKSNSITGDLHLNKQWSQVLMFLGAVVGGLGTIYTLFRDGKDGQK